MKFSKSISSLLLALIVAAPVFGQSVMQTSAVSYPPTVEAPALAAAEWEATSHNFGQVPQGTPVAHRFEVKNTSNVPLVIASVKPSCQCTVTEYSTEAIAPGESGYVMARYSAASPGFFNKSVTVRLNVEGEMVILKLSGQVLPEESGE